MNSRRARPRIMVTGADGNLGSKLVPFLEKAPWCGGVIAIDRDAGLLAARYGQMSKVRTRALDLTAIDQSELDAVLDGVDTIVHFAVLNALPDSSWAEAAHSFDMTARLVLRAREKGLLRFVFASSNHALGNYGQSPLRDTVTTGALTGEVFAPGSKWDTADGEIIGYAYGAGKIFSERMCLAAAEPGGLSTVSIRLGWCQAGANHPATLDASGNPKLAALGRMPRNDPEELRWFRNMWLSNRDFEHLLERSVLSDAVAWPAPGIVINGVSANAGMGWEIESARRYIGYVPRDNVWVAL